MKLSFNKASLIDFILILRTISIVIQIGLLCFVQLALDYHLPWLPLLSIIALEIVFNTFCYVLPQLKNNTGRPHILIQLLADVSFLGCLLLYSGGATNAFVSLLLIPIAIAAVCLPLRLLSIVTLSAVATYSYLLNIMPMHEMHGNIEGHFVAMWLNFIFSAAVVSIVISKMAKTINAGKLEIAKYREEQLKQEQMIALGVASTQVTHDLATPISSIQILLEELHDELNEELSLQTKAHSGIQDIINTLEEQAARCGTNIANFRNITLDIKNKTQKAFPINALLEQIKHYCHLAYAEHHLTFEGVQNITPHQCIWADSSLPPALINIIDNAVKFNDKSKNKIIFSAAIHNQMLCIKITDSGIGFKLDALSSQAHNIKHTQTEKAGLGIALLLSNATIERLQGSIAINNRVEGGAEVNITFPLYNNKS